MAPVEKGDSSRVVVVWVKRLGAVTHVEYGVLRWRLCDSDSVARLDGLAALLPRADEGGAVPGCRPNRAGRRLAVRGRGRQAEVGASEGMSLYPGPMAEAGTLTHLPGFATYAALRRPDYSTRSTP